MFDRFAMSGIFDLTHSGEIFEGTERMCGLWQASFDRLLTFDFQAKCLFGNCNVCH